jgi:hypothetical protein
MISYGASTIAHDVRYCVTKTYVTRRAESSAGKVTVVPPFFCSEIDSEHDSMVTDRQDGISHIPTYGRVVFSLLYTSRSVGYPIAVPVSLADRVHEMPRRSCDVTAPAC